MIMKRRTLWTVPLLSLCLIVSACGSGNQPRTLTDNGGGSTIRIEQNDTQGPSQLGIGMGLYGDGKTSYGYDNGIGSVRTQGSGISSLLDSQFKLLGMSNTEVLVIGDTVIVGMPPGGNGNYEFRAGTPTHWDPYETSSLVQTLLGTGVLVLTVTEPEALDAIARVQKSMTNFSQSDHRTISSDINLILDHAKVLTGTRNRKLKDE
jgi:hypothetical protein